MFPSPCWAPIRSAMVGFRINQEACQLVAQISLEIKPDTGWPPSPALYDPRQQSRVDLWPTVVYSPRELVPGVPRKRDTPCLPPSFHSSLGVPLPKSSPVASGEVGEILPSPNSA